VSVDVHRALARALEVLIPALDIVGGRAEDGEVPAWCEARGLAGFLLSLDEAALERCEAQGLAAFVLGEERGAPAALVDLARATSEATQLPSILAPARPSERPAPGSVSARKQQQIEPLLAAVRPMAERAGRIVDVGAGRGHLTRIAAARFDREALGLEREGTRVEAARVLAARDHGDGTVRFEASDVCEDELTFEASDLVLGLHACGEVGDRMTTAAARSGADLALVACCPQKIRLPERPPLSRAAREAGLWLRREALGLANLTARPVGVEGQLTETMVAREHRSALRALLRARGVEVAPGEEMRGINRRRAHDPLPELAARALALRRLPAATEAELGRGRAEGSRIAARARRIALPRSMLARLVEVSVSLDRAASLAESGHAAMVATLCDAAVTPRNLALLASRDPMRLPQVVTTPSRELLPYLRRDDLRESKG
jgi:SAM-dependent methyltransferase